MAGQNISHEGHRQRMRARVEQYGLESLAPHEALEYLLYITNARRDTNASPTRCWSGSAALPVCWKPVKKNSAVCRASARPAPGCCISCPR